MCTCVLGMLILPVSMIFRLFDCGAALTVWYVFLCHFISWCEYISRMAAMIETAVQVVMNTDCTVLCKSKYALGYHDTWSGFWVDKHIDILSVMQVQRSVKMLDNILWSQWKFPFSQWWIMMLFRLFSLQYNIGQNKSLFIKYWFIEQCI